MKKLFKKTWFTGILITGLILAAFFINLWIMSLELTWSSSSVNLLDVSITQLNEGPIKIFAFVLMLLFYISILPILLSLISLFKKKNWGFVIAGLVFLGFDITLIVFQSIGGYLPLLGSILIVVNIIILLSTFTFVIIRSKTIKDTENIKDISIDNNLKNSPIPFILLIIDIIAIAVFLTTFIIPIYSEVRVGSDYNAILANVLFLGDTTVIVMIFFFVNFVIFLGIFLYFANSLSNYVVNKAKFIRQSKILIILIFVATSIFFLAGLVTNIFFTIIYAMETTSIAYIPMLIMFVVIIIQAILIGKAKDYHQIASGRRKIKYPNIEPLFYVLILTAVTALALFIPIIKFDIVSGTYTHYINLTGFEIIRDYASLQSGYRLAAYLIVIMLISISFCLIISIASYLSKSKKFISIVSFTTIVNVFFVFIIGLAGYYFQIARDINKAIVLDIADFYGIHFNNTSALQYVVGTDAIYLLIGTVLVLIVMFARRVFDRNETPITENGLLQASSQDTTITESEEIQDFDPCYSFTELDVSVPLFKKELDKRKALKPKETTLNGLVNFVVDYARNSRLHLSYTPEDIATFVAGLGASKLSILQGMSGTGKTSLPKIFSEAIYGNCDIIEVESSWKDKHELLGYYNEFSRMYTPKKFTLALYKAALNQEIFTFILLDEMNLSRIEYYFSDFLSLMENEENQREIKLVNINLSRTEATKDIEYLALKNGHTLKVPANVWFIGTANRDESTFVISDKVYDRAHTMNFTKRAPKVRNYQDPIPQQYYDYKTMNNLFETAKKQGTFDAENNDLIRSIETLLAPYNISFGNRILKQIEEFVNIYKACFINDDVESEAIEKILLSKVVAKLEVKTIEDKEKLEMEFVKLNLHQCADFVKHLDED